MQMAHVADWKKDTVAKLRNIIKDHKTVAVVRVDRIPGVQLQNLRAHLRDRMSFMVAKKTLIKLALESMKDEKPGVEKLTDILDGQAAILGTDMNPFSLYKILNSNVQPMPAKGGEEAPEDIRVEAGETSFPPGPIVGELGKVGIPAAIDKGKVIIRKTVTPVKKGNVISRDLALALTKLEIFPFQVGIALDGAWEEGLIYRPSDLDVDMDAYKQDLITGAQLAMNLAVFTAYMTPKTAVPIIRKARIQALNLAVNTGILNKDSSDLILSKAYGEMLALAGIMSAEALDEDLRALVAGAAAAQPASAAPGEAASGEEAAAGDGGKEKEAEEEEVSEEDAMAGLGALFG
ncbi:MAG TPA: 50S ribosomal protein L10 [Euryarchaeota archaeon]|nr:50S ribosomal protein L10 [Euryarchaeota archaeon]